MSYASTCSKPARGGRRERRKPGHSTEPRAASSRPPRSPPNRPPPNGATCATRISGPCERPMRASPRFVVEIRYEGMPFLLAIFHRSASEPEILGEPGARVKGAVQRPPAPVPRSSERPQIRRQSHPSVRGPQGRSVDPLDHVKPECGSDHLGNLPGLERERGLLEFRDRLAA